MSSRKTKKPSKKTTKKTTSRRYKKRTYAPLTSTRLTPSYATTGVGLPKSKLVNLHYTEHKSMAGGDSWTFMINSAYDVNAAVGGHQPKGYDQWASFYNNYMVVGAKYRFTILWDAGFPATYGPMEFVQILNRDTVPTGGWDTYLETNAGTGTGILKTQTDAQCVLEGKFSAKKFFNIANPTDNHSIGAGVNANPSYPAYLILYSRGFGGASNLAEYTVKVDIEMAILFTEPAELGGS